MKAKERHHLKQNEFAETAARVAGQVRDHQGRLLTGVAAIAIAAAVAGGYFFWRNAQNEKAGVLLGDAYAVAQSAVAPPSTLPGAVQQPGTFPTEAARADATIKSFQQVVTSYPSSTAAVAARYEIAAVHLETGRFSDAAAGFNTVIAGKREPYASTARLGLAQALLAEGKNAEALKLLTDLSAERDGPLPVDGVLVQLARANVKAGKIDDARAAYKRVIDEFADSQYAADARQALAGLNY